MADYTKYTKQEMQAYAIAKNIKENQIVIVGTGLRCDDCFVNSTPFFLCQLCAQKVRSIDSLNSS